MNPIVPVVLFNQFKFFFNLYFLLVALTQFIPVRYATDRQTSTLSIIRNQGSGDFSALSGTCGFIEVPRGSDVNGAFNRFRFFPLP